MALLPPFCLNGAREESACKLLLKLYNTTIMDYKELNKKEFYKLRHEWRESSKEYSELKEISDVINIKFVDYIYNFTKEQNIPNPFEKVKDKNKSNRGSEVDLTSSSEAKSLYRKIMIRTHPDKNKKNSNLYIEATKAKKENNLHKLLDVGKKLKLNLSDISRDQLDILESNITDIHSKIKNIKISYPWIWFHGSQKTKHEVVYDFLNHMECLEN